MFGKWKIEQRVTREHLSVTSHALENMSKIQAVELSQKSQFGLCKLAPNKTPMFQGRNISGFEIAVVSMLSFLGK